MTQGSLKIHTENILPIIKKWLYSDKEIFLRELVANACDALGKIKVVRQGEGQDSGELRIDITIDKRGKTLQIADTGIGMTSDEVEKYIAQVAFSGAEEFLSTYKNAHQIIGHFGLGFYSAYMVAAKVEIDTLSYLPGAEPVSWSCDGSSTYTLEKGRRERRGTTITLFLDDENIEYLEEARLRQILERYCPFLPFPIYLSNRQINAEEPLWLKSPSQCTDQEYLAFYRKLYPLESDPIFWIHLNIDYPFRAQAILYFPKLKSRFDSPQTALKLFCNRVFVTDNCKELLPDYLSSLRGALDSPDLPLNVSRSALQMDKNIRSLSNHIAKKITDRLYTLYTTEKERFLSLWEDLESWIKLGILQDDKLYERAKEFLVWKSTDNQWLTPGDYLAAFGSKTKEKIFYTQEATQIGALYRQQGIELLISRSPIDTPLMQMLEKKIAPAQFRRVDGSLPDLLLDPAREKKLLNADGRSEAAHIAAFFQRALNKDHLTVDAKSLDSQELPALLLIEEEERRLRDYFALTGQSTPSGFAAKQTFVVNTNSPLVGAIFALREKNPPLAQELSHHLYTLNRLAHKELDPEELFAFAAQATSLLQQLLAHV